MTTNSLQNYNIDRQTSLFGPACDEEDSIDLNDGGAICESANFAGGAQIDNR